MIGNGRSSSNNSLQHDSRHTTRRVASANDNVFVNQLLNLKKPLQGEFPLSMGNELQGINNYGALSGRCESVDSLLNVKLPSPMLVTLLGAGGCRRRKRIKVVSCYILGPLLGEGVFGVVRDAIDTSANGVFPPCFQRVAIKSYKYCRSSPPTLVPTFDPVVGSCSAAASPPSVGNLPISEAQKRKDLKMRRLLESEACNLQRFHCPNIIRSKDIFTRDGKDFVVLPIAVCNLDQLVKKTVRYGFCQRQGVFSSNNSAHVFQQERRNTSLSKNLESDMILDVACASHMSPGENEVNRLSSTVNEAAAPLFSAEFIRSIMYQLLNGVAYLHNQGLAHNDLKPKNILIFANGELKISDLAGVFEEYNDQGTPMYVSPEICKHFYCAGDAEDDKKVVKVDALKNDMWSCGVILYYLLTGRPLWCPHPDTRNKYQLYREIASQESQINLDHVPEPRESAAMTTPTTMEDPLVKTNVKPEHSTVEGFHPRVCVTC
ncbi:protein kinase [Trypanosoma rangeli SC58]|uniref:Protein kinase n=1 Tax=Trypanosoma rangeli SC58 TaxID=429131 RepID=A0A061IWB3_TRYRA|nr:protein kinase [Trypanosoma rangeli SC58]